MAGYNPADFDTRDFTQEGYSRLIKKPWGHELHWTPDGLPYMGKILHIKAGEKVSLQAHDAKQESWTVLSGKCKVQWDDSEGKLVETLLLPDKGYTCQVGQRHRLIGVSDCYVLEVSTPEIGTTWRLEDMYSRPHETEELREERNKGL